MIKENYLYFAESTVETGITGGGTQAGANFAGNGGVVGCDPEAALLPVSSFLGLDIATNTVTLKFKSAAGYATTTSVALTCATANIKKVIEASNKIMNSYPHASGFIVFADAEVVVDSNGAAVKKSQFHPLLEGLVTGVSMGDSVSCVGG